MRYSKKKYHGGSKSKTFFKPLLGHPWTYNVASWPGISPQSTPSCNGITQSNHYPVNKLGMGSGVPIATNILHGGNIGRKTKKKHHKTKQKYRKTKHKTNQKRKKKKEKNRKTKKQLRGGSMTRLFPESLVNLTRSAMSLPLKLSNTWSGRSQPNSLDSNPFSQPIGNINKPFLNIGYKLTPKDVQSMAANNSFA